MDDCVVRVLEVLRLMPDEMDRLHNEEVRETVPVDYDPETGTCSQVIARTPRCWMPWEIQEVFHKPPLKEYYHLSGRGVFAEQETAERFTKIQRAVKAALFEGAQVMFSKCNVCGWAETTWDSLWVSGEIGPHEEECKGVVRVSGVRELETPARISFTLMNLHGIHSLDSIIEKKRERLTLAVAEFTDPKNKPKSRLERIKEEAKKSLDLI